MKILIYSGDTDGAVPIYGTRRWIKKLEWRLVEALRPWLTDN